MGVTAAVLTERAKNIGLPIAKDACESTLELYTVADDEAAAEIAGRIENEVLFDVDYEKFMAPIEDEECFQTAYEVKGLLRKVKGAKKA